MTESLDSSARWAFSPSLPDGSRCASTGGSPSLVALPHYRMTGGIHALVLPTCSPNDAPRRGRSKGNVGTRLARSLSGQGGRGGRGSYYGMGRVIGRRAATGNPIPPALPMGGPSAYGSQSPLTGNEGHGASGATGGACAWVRSLVVRLS